MPGLDRSWAEITGDPFVQGLGREIGPVWPYDRAELLVELHPLPSFYGRIVPPVLPFAPLRPALSETKFEVLVIANSERRITERAGHRSEAVALARDLRQRLYVDPDVPTRSFAVSEHTCVRLSLMSAAITKRRRRTARASVFARYYDQTTCVG
jgi:hypothetical protein